MDTKPIISMKDALGEVSNLSNAIHVVIEATDELGKEFTTEEIENLLTIADLIRTGLEYVKGLTTPAPTS